MCQSDGGQISGAAGGDSLHHHCRLFSHFWKVCAFGAKTVLIEMCAYFWPIAIRNGASSSWCHRAHLTINLKDNFCVLQRERYGPCSQDTWDGSQQGAWLQLGSNNHLCTESLTHLTMKCVCSSSMQKFTLTRSSRATCWWTREARMGRSSMATGSYRSPFPLSYLTKRWKLESSGRNLFPAA